MHDLLRNVFGKGGILDHFVNDFLDLSIQNIHPGNCVLDLLDRNLDVAGVALIETLALMSASVWAKLLSLLSVL